MKQRKILKIKKNFKKNISLPGSKSITNRDFVLASLAKGKSILRDIGLSDDSDRMREALSTLGIKIEKISNQDFEIYGRGGDFDLGEKKIYLGGSGTSTRFLLALSVLREGKTILDGNESLRARPQRDLLDAIDQLGLKVKSKNDSYLPIEIDSLGLDSITQNKIKMRGDISSQYFTALMQIAPILANGLEIEVEGDLVSKPYIDITINEMSKFGVKVENLDYKKFIISNQKYKPQDLKIEGDASAASYFLALATIHGGEVKINNLGKSSVQGDLGFYRVCEKLGARVKIQNNSLEIKGPVDGKLKELNEIDMEDIPDTAQTLMTIASFVPGGVKIRGIQNLRFKECDRINAPATELRKLGVEVETGDDYIRISEKQDFSPEYSGLTLENISIDTYDDHRMAMSFAVLGTKIGGFSINYPDCVNKTFPAFWEELARFYE